MRFSIVIPILNEGSSLSGSLQQLIDRIDDFSQTEIIVCDGGSLDDSREQASRFPLQLIETARGRAHQMNAGANHATGDWLLFLHSDTQLPDDWMQALENCGRAWGRFDVKLSGSHGLLRIVERAINLRSRLSSVSTGDQVLFFRRDFFKRIGGFPDVPLMEDIAISKTARQHSPPANLDSTVITSSRRWEQNGILRTILLMWWLRLCYWLGVSPQRLHRWYYGR